MTLDDELLEVFREEVGVQLEEMSAILAGAPAGWDLPRSFHLAHNVKGAGRMIGAGAFSRVAHALEDLFAEARASGRVARPLAALAREGAALGHACFEQLGAEVEPDVRGYVDRVAAALRRRAGGRTRSESDASPGPVASSETLRSTIPSSETLHAHLEASPIASTHLAHTDESAAAEPLREIEPRAGASTVRVAVDKLQVLMGLGAELMTGAERSEARRVLAKRLVRDLRDMRRGHPSVARHEGLARALASAAELLSALERDHVRSQQLADRLQDGIRRLRMVRVDTLRLALGRAVQSAALAAGRSAELRIEGGDTEVDRAILERLRDPLMHLVRNAVAHGIEDARARAAAGKPAQGTIVLIARGEGSWVELVVQDDGRGVDLDAVRAKALREGLVSHAAGADELFDLLFRAGFSTAATVSELAGRGFGMDIVRTRLEKMGGSVSIGSRDDARADGHLGATHPDRVRSRRARRRPQLPRAVRGRARSRAQALGRRSRERDGRRRAPSQDPHPLARARGDAAMGNERATGGAGPDRGGEAEPQVGAGLGREARRHRRVDRRAGRAAARARGDGRAPRVPGADRAAHGRGLHRRARRVAERGLRDAGPARVARDGAARGARVPRAREGAPRPRARTIALA
ncbi:MAG: Hpt domain-containing protein [Sandaracinaceae bacterium]|nr:Hpt domain-containing protein [Sandaracinaceae bacterium]